MLCAAGGGRGLHSEERAWGLPVMVVWLQSLQDRLPKASCGLGSQLTSWLVMKMLLVVKEWGLPVRPRGKSSGVCGLILAACGWAGPALSCVGLDGKGALAHPHGLAASGDPS